VVGVGLLWLSRGWRPFAEGQTEANEEVTSVRRADIYHFGKQWFLVATVSGMILAFLPLLMTVPSWLTKDPGQATWSQMMTGFIMGLVWALGNYFWRIARRRGRMIVTGSGPNWDSAK